MIDCHEWPAQHTRTDTDSAGGPCCCALCCMRRAQTPRQVWQPSREHTGRGGYDEACSSSVVQLGQRADRLGLPAARAPCHHNDGIEQERTEGRTLALVQAQVFGDLQEQLVLVTCTLCVLPSQLGPLGERPALSQILCDLLGRATSLKCRGGFASTMCGARYCSWCCRTPAAHRLATCELACTSFTTESRDLSRSG